ncbi:MAG: hypothetical protein VW879_02460 [Opitutae bacterium]
MFRLEMDQILDRGLQRIATTVAKGLFASKIDTACQRVEAAERTVEALFGEERELQELAEYRLEKAVEQLEDVLEQKRTCYFYVYEGEVEERGGCL